MTFISFITAHDIYKLFDDFLEVRRVFVDIINAFDKALHEGLLLKLNGNGMSENLLKLLRDFLHCRKQRVLLRVLCYAAYYFLLV